MSSRLHKHAFAYRDDRRRAAFTLIEIMIVIGIAAVMMATTIPFVGSMLNKKPVVDGTNEILDVLAQARAMAILKGQPSAVRIRPMEKSFTVVSVSSSSVPNGDAFEGAGSNIGVSGIPKKALSTTLHPDITIEMVAVNYIERMNDEVAEVFFYPNGTCDEFTLVFQMYGENWRKIHLDVLTGLSDFETDPQRFAE